MKLIVLGIDSLDRLLLERLATQLPNFTALLAAAPAQPVRTTFPPDSDTAWATIHTGLNPAQHGILRFVDPLQKSYQILNAPAETAVGSTLLPGQTFWEILSAHGFTTCAVFPHLAYPLSPDTLSPHNPITCITARSSTGLVQSSPSSLLDLYPDVSLLPGVTGLPPRTAAARLEYARRLNRRAAADAEFALTLLSLHDFDLFFAYFSTLDATSHFFWPSGIPAPLSPNPLLEAYRLYDTLLARFLAAIDPSTPFLLLSDHGHGSRPPVLFNINELLRRAGFLVARPLARSPHHHLVDRSKRLILRFINRFSLARPAAGLMRRFPRLLEPFTRPAIINWERTLACATDLSGVKAYSYGGIRLNPSLTPSHRYEETRSQIIRLLEQNCQSSDGASLIQFILPREALHHGPHLDLYPDILLQLIDGYGLGWGVQLPLLTPADSHNLVPGSHRGDTGVFVYRGERPLRPALDTVDLLDVTPSILDLFDIPPAFPYDGTSIFASSP